MARKTKAPAAEAPPATETAAAPDREQRDEAATLRDLTEAQALRQQVLLEGGDDGALDALDDEIRQHQIKLARFAEARKLREAQNTKEARAARRQRVRDELQAALDDARTLGEQSKELLIAVVELGARLSSIEQTKAAIRSRIVEHVTAERLRTVDNAIAALTLPHPFLSRLFSAGIGRTGVELQDNVSIKPLGRSYIEPDPDEAIAKAVATLKLLATDALNAREAA